MRFAWGRHRQPKPRGTGERGVLAFAHTAEVIRAEAALRAAGFGVRVMGPPPGMRAGCDMVVEFELVREVAARQALAQVGLEPLAAVPAGAGMLEPVSLFATTDFGQWLMVRAANMKITVAKADHRIVNVSGGGCPDVPALAELLTGQVLEDAPSPLSRGQTLCAYSLELAFREARRTLGAVSGGPAAGTDTADTARKDGPQQRAVLPARSQALVTNGSQRLPWLICGTVPDEAFAAPGGLLHGQCDLDQDGTLRVAGVPISVRRGTPALLAACTAACQALGVAPPQALLAADTGRGEGSRKLYADLAMTLADLAPAGMTFHYLFPDVAGHDAVLFAVQAMARRPLLVADAGFMYVAKMSGQAQEYDLFTPDAGELAFLADELAPHPFYTRGFLLGAEAAAKDLAMRAWETGGAARTLLIKGREDLVVTQGRVQHRVCGPDTPAMEAIGGTGDTLTGMVTALLMSGMAMEQACARAATANRLLGVLAAPTPATAVGALVSVIDRAIPMSSAISPAMSSAQVPAP